MLSHRGKPHPQALRDRVFAYSDGGMQAGNIAKALLVSESYVSKVLSRRRLIGETAARPQRCDVMPKLAGHMAAIEARIEAHPDATLAELRDWLAAEHTISASLGLLSKTLRALNLTLKKRHSMPQSRSAPASRPSARTGASVSRHSTRRS